MQDPRYPIGKFSFRKALTPEDRKNLIQQIADTPSNVRRAVDGLSDEQLDTPYRDGGWTVRQVVHHLVDSHVNAYVRSKFALTEINPTIMAYDQAMWAELEDARKAPVGSSLAILDGLHARWVRMLRSLQDEDFSRTLQHPEQGAIDVDWLLQLYGWHGRHHTAHITELRKRKGW